jgi:hypothetical protein
MIEIPEGSHVFMAIGPHDFTPGANFFFVVIPPGRYNWHKKIMPAMNRFASQKLGLPAQKKERRSGRIEKLISDFDGFDAPEWRNFLANRIAGKNNRVWVLYDPASSSFKEIQFP